MSAPEKRTPGGEARIFDVEPQRRAASALDAIATSRQQWSREHRRPQALSAREALVALQFEALLVATAAGNVRSGVTLNDEDFDRLAVAVRSIDLIVGEVS